MSSDKNRDGKKITKLKSKKKRTESSRKWLLRQLNDPFVNQAKKDGYRSRAAYKLEDIQQKFKIFKKNGAVVDLGCAPGGWLQVARAFIAPTTPLIGIDLLDVEALAHTIILKGDFTELSVQQHLSDQLQGSKAWVVMSDMAASACGVASVDFIRIMDLLEQALDFAFLHLDKGGHFIAKVLRGGTEQDLLLRLKASFKVVKHFKPSASRQDSAEMYVVAMHFKGN